MPCIGRLPGMIQHQSAAVYNAQQPVNFNINETQHTDVACELRNARLAW